MPRFTENDLSKRREAAASAKKAMLERFRARRASDHPVVVEQKAARLAASQARETTRRAKIQRAAAEQQARAEEEARLAREQAESEAAERRAEADRAVALLAEQKAAPRPALCRAQGTSPLTHGEPAASEARVRKGYGYLVARPESIELPTFRSKRDALSTERWAPEAAGAH